MANIYTVTQTSTANIDPSVGLLDNGATFPPGSGYFLTISPNPGQEIAANQFRIGTGTIPMEVNLQGNLDSQTQWPSKMEWIYISIDQPSPGGFPTSSGLFEFPGYYKVVFQDSENPTNALNFTGGGTNQVYVWIYFGKNRTTPVVSHPNGTITDFQLLLDIDFDIDIIPRRDTLQQNSAVLDTGTLTSFTI
tara:strand:- start:140 stop:715 length:576 start_codon:yes stop_codon:yes gene_type:complete